MPLIAMSPDHQMRVIGHHGASVAGVLMLADRVAERISDHQSRGHIEFKQFMLELLFRLLLKRADILG